MKSIRTIVATLAVAAAGILGAVVLSAHMQITKSEPAANTEVAAPVKHVQVFFTEEPDLKVSKLEIKGPDAGTKLTMLHVMDKSLMAMVEGPTPAGSYTVSWQSAGDDGHAAEGRVQL
ncbi:MAG: copper resistance protein CopC [Vicinamibacterales bacterium]